MNRPRLQLVILALIAGLATLLWNDLARFSQGLAERRYRANDFAAARDAWQLALKLRSRDLTNRFNRGVAQYRLGNYAAAQADFSVIGSSSDPLLRRWALYNQGNSLVRLAEQDAARNGTAADNLYRAALERYRQALILNPDDPDARANLANATTARAALLAAQGSRPPDAKRPAVETPTGATASGQKQDKGQSGTRQAAKDGARRGRAADDDQGGSGRKRKTMGREQAERLLNEKRGQEALPSAILAAPGGKDAAPPLKDW